MRRWLVLLVVALLVMPSAAMAQESTPIATVANDAELARMFPSASNLGNGWSVVEPTVKYGAPNFPRARLTYVGPNGARLIIAAWDISSRISDRADDWGDLAGDWENWVRYFTHSGVAERDWPTIYLEDMIDSPLPNGVNDAFRFVGEDVYFGQIAATGLYSFESGPAVMIILSGRVGDRDGLDAMEWLIEEMIEKEKAAP